MADRTLEKGGKYAEEPGIEIVDRYLQKELEAKIKLWCSDETYCRRKLKEYYQTYGEDLAQSGDVQSSAASGQSQSPTEESPTEESPTQESPAEESPTEGNSSTQITPEKSSPRNRSRVGHSSTQATPGTSSPRKRSREGDSSTQVTPRTSSPRKRSREGDPDIDSNGDGQRPPTRTKSKCPTSASTPPSQEMKLQVLEQTDTAKAADTQMIKLQVPEQTDTVKAADTQEMNLQVPGQTDTVKAADVTIPASPMVGTPNKRSREDCDEYDGREGDCGGSEKRVIKKARSETISPAKSPLGLAEKTDMILPASSRVGTPNKRSREEHNEHHDGRDGDCRSDEGHVIKKARSKGNSPAMSPPGLAEKTDMIISAANSPPRSPSRLSEYADMMIAALSRVENPGKRAIVDEESGKCAKMGEVGEEDVMDVRGEKGKGVGGEKGKDIDSEKGKDDNKGKDTVGKKVKERVIKKLRSAPSSPARLPPQLAEDTEHIRAQPQAVHTGP